MRKVEAAFGGGDQRVETKLFADVLRYSRVGEGILQSRGGVIRPFELTP